MFTKENTRQLQTQYLKLVVLLKYFLQQDIQFAPEYHNLVQIKPLQMMHLILKHQIVEEKESKDELNQANFLQLNKNQEIDTLNNDQEIKQVKQSAVAFQFFQNQNQLTNASHKHQKSPSLSINVDKTKLKSQKLDPINRNNDNKKDINLTENKLLNDIQETNFFDKNKQSNISETYSPDPFFMTKSKEQNNSKQQQLTINTSSKKQQTSKNKNNSQSQMLLSSIIQNKKFTSLDTQSDPINLTSINNGGKTETPVVKINENKFKKLLQSTTNGMKLSVFEYIKYFFWPFGQVKKKKQIIDYSLDKLYYHLDALNVIKKLLEVDKLKKLIMDSDQIKLFEYISKPTIKEEEVFNKNNDQEYNEYDIQYQDNRTEIQKLQDAFKAYQNVKSRDYKSQMDKKLINLIDPNMVDLFSFNLDSKECSSISDRNNNYNLNIQQQQISRKQSKEMIDYTQIIKSQNSPMVPMVQSKFFFANIQDVQDSSEEEDKQSSQKPKGGELNENSIVSDIDIPNEDFEKQNFGNVKLQSSQIVLT